MPEPLILIGGGGHAAVVAEAAVASGSWLVAGYLAPRPASPATGSGPTGTWLGTDDDALTEGGLLAAERGAWLVIGLGGTSPADRARREALIGRYERAGHRFATIVHPAAWVSPSAILHPGAVVLAGGVVNARATLGRQVILNTRAVVEHDVVVGTHAQLGPGAVVGGGATIGKGAFVGLGASIRDHVTIGDRAVVGMGSVVTRDVAPDAVVVGNPARERGRP